MADALNLGEGENTVDDALLKIAKQTINKSIFKLASTISGTGNTVIFSFPSSSIIEDNLNILNWSPTEEPNKIFITRKCKLRISMLNTVWYAGKSSGILYLRKNGSNIGNVFTSYVINANTDSIVQRTNTNNTDFLEVEFNENDYIELYGTVTTAWGDTYYLISGFTLEFKEVL